MHKSIMRPLPTMKGCGTRVNVGKCNLVGNPVFGPACANSFHFKSSKPSVFAPTWLITSLKSQSKIKYNKVWAGFQSLTLSFRSLNLKIVLLVRDPRGTMQSRTHRVWCPGNPDCDDPSMLCSDLVGDYKNAQHLSKEYPDSFRWGVIQVVLW